MIDLTTDPLHKIVAPLRVTGVPMVVMDPLRLGKDRRLPDRTMAPHRVLDPETLSIGVHPQGVLHPGPEILSTGVHLLTVGVHLLDKEVLGPGIITSPLETRITTVDLRPVGGAMNLAMDHLECLVSFVIDVVVCDLIVCIS